MQKTESLEQQVNHGTEQSDHRGIQKAMAC